jgi:hypothetical protein
VFINVLGDVTGYQKALIITIARKNGGSIMIGFYPLQNQYRPYAHSDGTLPASPKNQLQEMR